MFVQESVNVAAIQMVSGIDVQQNLQQAGLLIKQAADKGARFIVLPEYFCFMGKRDKDKLALLEDAGNGPIQEFLAQQAKQNDIYLLGGTISLRSPDAARIYNSSLIFDPQGQQCARYDKIHLFSFSRGAESYDESIAIRPGDNAPQVIDLPFGKVAMAICYDLRFPEFFRSQGDVKLMVLPAAFTYTTGAAHWEILLRARAIENQCYVLASAQGGVHENGRRTWGHSMFIDPWGDVLESLAAGPGVVMGAINDERLQDVRSALPALQHRVL